MIKIEMKNATKKKRKAVLTPQFYRFQSFLQCGGGVSPRLAIQLFGYSYETILDEKMLFNSDILFWVRSVPGLNKPDLGRKNHPCNLRNPPWLYNFDFLSFLHLGRIKQSLFFIFLSHIFPPFSFPLAIIHSPFFTKFHCHRLSINTEHTFFVP